MSSENTSLQKESVLRKYFYLWLILGSSTTLFLILGLHTYADSIPEGDVIEIKTNIQYGITLGQISWVCYLDGVDKGKVYPLSADIALRNMTKISPTSFRSDAEKYCNTLSNEKSSTDYWSLLK